MTIVALSPMSQRALQLALEQIGWEILAIEFNATLKHLRVEVRRDGLLATLDSRPHGATLTRERARMATVSIGRRGDRCPVDRLSYEFVGRSRFADGSAALTALASYVVDNGNGGELPASAIVRLLSAPAIPSPHVDTEDEGTHGPPAAS